MKESTAELLAAADLSLGQARAAIGHPILTGQAARLAYLAMFHAARALIFERTDALPKTHKGVMRQFHRLARSEKIDPNLPAQLTRMYSFKQGVDYEPTRLAPIVADEATKAIETAERLVLQVRSLLVPTLTRRKLALRRLHLEGS